MEDRALAKLSASLAGARGVSKKLLLKLDKLEKKLSSMDSKVSAVQDATDSYLTAKYNISAVLSEVEKTNEFFRVVKQVEPVVKAGILSGQRDQFLNAISRLAAAHTFFSERKKDIKAAPQMLKAVGNLLKVSLCDHFLS
jgi:hypothetical protein